MGNKTNNVWTFAVKVLIFIDNYIWGEKRLGDISNYVYLRKWHLFSLRQHIKFFKSEPCLKKKKVIRANAA